MAEETAVKNGRISNFKGLVTLTLARVILHSVVYHLSTSTYLPNFTEIEETFCGRTDVRTYVRTNGWTDGHLRPALLGRLCWRVDLVIAAGVVVIRGGRRGERRGDGAAAATPTAIPMWSMVLSSWQSHCKSSRGSCNQPSDQPPTWDASLPVPGCSTPIISFYYYYYYSAQKLTQFNVSQRVEGWVDTGTAVKVCSCTQDCIVINTTVHGRFYPGVSHITVGTLQLDHCYLYDLRGLLKQFWKTAL